MNFLVWIVTVSFMMVGDLRQSGGKELNWFFFLSAGDNYLTFDDL
jgi:hypothetical protein